ncbi:MAG: LEA type 2 family protein [Thaumarchaeota archaeon]|nr:LEA type 2 family protein [Nitrososphaerota archaeon]
MKPIATIGIIIAAIIVIVVGLIAYSYTQIQISLDSLSFGGFDWAPASLTTLAKLVFNTLTGNLIGTVLSLITGVKLNLIFALSNHGIFPVYIPDLSYNLSVNGVNVGQGQSSADMTINPGETKTLPILQDFTISSLEPAAVLVLDEGGMMDIQVSGTAYFKFLGLTIPIPFQSTKQINVIQEAKNHFLGSGSQNSGYPPNTYQPPLTVTNINIQTPSYTVSQGQSVTFSGKLTDSNGNGIPNQLVYVKRDITLAPDSFLGSSYTDSNGDYTVTWAATKPLTSNTANVYATFEGSSGFTSSRSSEISIQVIAYQPSTIQPQITPPQTSQPYTIQAARFPIANSQYQVGPGTYTYIPFNMQCSGTATGSFSASAALGDNIIVYIMDSSGFSQFKAGNSANTYYNSDKVASGTFNIGLPSGQYYLVLSNTYSAFSTKNVSLEASYTCN